MGIWASLLVAGKKILLNSIELLLPDIITEGVKMVGEWIKENIFDLSDTPSYREETATLEETKKINELISKCVTGYKEQAKEYDELAEKILEDQFLSIIENLKEINKILPVIEDYVFHQFSINLETIKSNLENIFSKKISNVFSSYNNELIAILELEAGYNKKEKLNQLALDTMASANEEFNNKLLKAIQEQQKFIDSKLNDYVKKRDIELENSKKLTEKILSKSNKDEKEKMKLDFTDSIEDLNLLEEILLNNNLINTYEEENNEIKKVKYNSLFYDLENYFKEYKIFIETSSIFDLNIEKFLYIAIPLIKKYNNKIFIPYKIIKDIELKKINNRILKILNDKSIFDIRGEKEDENETLENIIKKVFIIHRKNYKLILISQNEILGKKIIELNKSVTEKEDNKIKVLKINKEGFLEE